MVRIEQLEGHAIASIIGKANSVHGYVYLWNNGDLGIFWLNDHELRACSSSACLKVRPRTYLSSATIEEIRRMIR